MSEIKNIFESFKFVTYYYHDRGVNANTAQKHFTELAGSIDNVGTHNQL